MTTLPQFRFNEQALDASPAALGLLRSSTDALDDREELHQRMALDGYLFLPSLLDRDQVQDWATRKNMTLADAERWLAPNLNYDPA